MERFEAIENFLDLSATVVTPCEVIVYPYAFTDDDDDNDEMLSIIGEDWKWDAESKTRVQGILASFRDFEIIVSLVVLKNVLQPLREIIIKLQKYDLDIQAAYKLIGQVQKDIETLRADIDVRFDV